MQASQSSKPKSKQICKFGDLCKFYDPSTGKGTCRNKHLPTTQTSQTSRASQPSQTPEPKQFCKFGDSCKFYNPSTGTGTCRNKHLPATQPSLIPTPQQTVNGQQFSKLVSDFAQAATLGHEDIMASADRITWCKNEYLKQAKIFLTKMALIFNKLFGLALRNKPQPKQLYDIIFEFKSTADRFIAKIRSQAPPSQELFENFFHAQEVFTDLINNF